MNIYHHKVQYYETDKMGVTHHSNYIRWMEEARVDMLSRIGWDYKHMEDMGIVSPVMAVDCRYITGTTFSDDIYITVQVEEFKGVRLKLKYEMKNADSITVCEGHSEHCFLNSDGKILQIKKEYPALYTALIESNE